MPESRRRKPIFVGEDGDPIPFFFHRSVQEERERLSAAIEKYGGTVLDTDQGADTVLVDSEYAHLHRLQEAYHAHPDRQRRGIRVEITKFVFQCIRVGVFEHAKIQHYPMRGRHLGRMEYTPEDDESLCRYLAIRIPDPEAGGRLGHVIYQRLEELTVVMPEEFKWAARHPAQSWRERYRKNKDRLDEMIQRFVLEEEPTYDQRFPYDRRLNKAYKLREEQLALRQEEEEESEADSADDVPSSLFSREDPEVGTPYQAADSSPGRHRIQGQPDASQATLVGRGVAYKSPSRSMRTSGGAPLFPPESDHAESPELQRWTRSPDATAVAERAESPQRPLPPVELAPVPVPTRRSRRRIQEPVEVPTRDAPYQHTRARSRSVDPPSLPQTKRQPRNAPATSSTLTKPRRGRAVEEKPRQEIDEEIVVNSRQGKRRRVAEAEESAAGRQQEPASVLSTVNEEADVERLLTMEANGPSTGAAAAPQQHQQPRNLARPLPASSSDENPRPPQRSRRSRRVVDTDDEMISRQLMETNTPNPLDLMKEFRAESELRNTSTPTSRSRGVQPLLIPKTKPEDHADTEWEDKMTTPSDDSFPFRGTKASAVKQKVEEHLRNEVYVPAPDLRAAKYRTKSS